MPALALPTPPAPAPHRPCSLLPAALCPIAVLAGFLLAHSFYLNLRPRVALPFDAATIRAESGGPPFSVPAHLSPADNSLSSPPPLPTAWSLTRSRTDSEMIVAGVHSERVQRHPFASLAQRRRANAHIVERPGDNDFLRNRQRGRPRRRPRLPFSPPVNRATGSPADTTHVSACNPPTHRAA